MNQMRKKIGFLNMKPAINYIQILFLTLVFIATSCDKNDTNPLVANAGPDQIVKPTEMVTLDGSGSSGPDGFTYSWKYTGTVPETEINFQNPASVSPTFTPPQNGLYSFTLTISAGGRTNEDVVLIEVTGALTIGGTLTDDTYLKNIDHEPDEADYILESDLVIPNGITLTIESHVRVEVAGDHGIIVNGVFTNANQGDYFNDISLTSATGWKGIMVDGGTVNLDGLTIANAGSSLFEGQSEAASVIFTGNAPTLAGFSNNEFIESSAYDILVNTAVTGSRSLKANTFSAGIPIKAPVDFITHFNGAGNYPAGYNYIHLIPNDVETGNELPGDDYYFFSEGKYYIDGTFRPKSSVYFTGNSTFYMRENASLIFEDTASLGSNYTGSTLITGLNGAKWNGIAVPENMGVKLNNIILSNAGVAPVQEGSINSNVKAAFYQKGQSYGWIWNSTIKDSDGYGFYLDVNADEASYFEIRNSEFINTKNAAVRTNAASVLYTIKPGNSCNLDNGVPGCLIEQDGQVSEFIWPAIENSYFLVDADISFMSFIQFNPGVHLKFKQDRSLHFLVNGFYDPNQIFIVEGESGNPVIFEGETNVPGSWGGLALEGNFNINHLQIKNGGGFLLPDASLKANMYFTNTNVGVAEYFKTFTNCTISGSDGHGIVLSNNAIDFDFEDPLKNNTFSTNNLGNVTREGK